MSRRQLPSLLALPVGVAAMFAGCDSGESPTRAIEQPNIVVVMTDDQGVTDWLDVLPTVRREIVAEGTTFEQSFATTPLCCPSRATFLTGQYGHNNGVLANTPGYPALRDPESVLPAWLQRAGYRTGHVGKWLHHYDAARGTAEGAKPAPGWDEWDALLDAKYYDYTLSVDGALEDHGEAPSDYANDVITDYGLRFLRQTDREPFFLWLAYVAPHPDSSAPAPAGPCTGAAVPAPEDVAAAFEPGFPRSPSVNERDVSDKLGFVANHPPLAPTELAALDQNFGCEQASLKSVDTGVGRIIDWLRNAGALDRTVIVFTSDNGSFHGEHRISGGKGLPYDPATRVPLAIRPPSAAAPSTGRVVDAPVANIDLAPTILDYTDAHPCVAPGDCRTLDGLSLRPLIEGDVEWPDRPIVLESDKPAHRVCKWEALRTEAYLYARYRVPRPDGPCAPLPAELYDVEADPDQLENLGRDSAYDDVRRQLEEELSALADCAGSACADG